MNDATITLLLFFSFPMLMMCPPTTWDEMFTFCYIAHYWLVVQSFQLDQIGLQNKCLCQHTNESQGEDRFNFPFSPNFFNEAHMSQLLIIQISFYLWLEWPKKNIWINAETGFLCFSFKKCYDYSNTITVRILLGKFYFGVVY